MIQDLEDKFPSNVFARLLVYYLRELFNAF